VRLLDHRYPEHASFPMPKLEEIRVFPVEPKAVSVLVTRKNSATMTS
jgi:hypothetical protein